MNPQTWAAGVLNLYCLHNLLWPWSKRRFWEGLDERGQVETFGFTANVYVTQTLQKHLLEKCFLISNLQIYVRWINIFTHLRVIACGSEFSQLTCSSHGLRIGWEALTIQCQVSRCLSHPAAGRATWAGLVKDSGSHTWVFIRITRRALETMDSWAPPLDFSFGGSEVGPEKRHF